MNITYPGKLIVIDGGDGAGKATQTHLLVEYFEKNNIPVKLVDFPRYDSFYGNVIGKFLRGEFGTLDQVSPYLAALPYAMDRAQMKEEIENFLAEGGYVIANRYVTSNMAHQGSKIDNARERDSFIQWVAELEYVQNNLPKENIVIYLHVPSEKANILTQTKADREYLQGEKQDIQEKNMDYRKKTEQLYLELVENNNHWACITCTEEQNILSIPQIHQKIVQTLQEKGIIDL